MTKAHTLYKGNTSTVLKANNAAVFGYNSPLFGFQRVGSLQLQLFKKKNYFLT